MIILGKDLQGLRGDVNIAPRTVETYKSTSGPDDTAALDDTATTLFPSGRSRRIRAGGAGNIKVLMSNGDTKLIESMLAGEQLDLECVKIFATGTTATKLSVYF
jgi:hypothetical protein